MDSNMDLNEIRKRLETIDKVVANAITKRRHESNEAFNCVPLSVPRVVAVSKLKPKQYIIEAYNCGQRHFGENYIQELFDKSNDLEIVSKCPQIKWHQIGKIQTNKINKLLGVKNLFLVETIDSQALAQSLNNALIKFYPNNHNKLKVLVQINTSQEENKNGIPVSNAIELIELIRSKCDRLEFRGLMSIGSQANSQHIEHSVSSLNPDFMRLIALRDDLSHKLAIPLTEIEMSFGMTDDYPQAIELGATNVRIGRAIFGDRN